MKQVRLQQGDSFAMNFIVKDNGQPKYIDSGENIAVGLYDEYGSKYVMKYIQDKDSCGKIEKTSQIGGYRTFVPGDITKDFIGQVDVEIVIYDKQRNVISHADKVLKMFFEERKINNDI